MTCLRCNGMVINQEILVDGYQIDDIYCVNCGERFFKNIPTCKLDKGKKWKREGLKFVNDFNKL